MKFTERLFPHPVLSYYSDDYNSYSFQAIPEPETRSNEVQCMVTFMLGEPELQAMIQNGLAEYVVHIECPYTRYRRVIRTGEDVAEVTVRLDEVIDRLEMNFFIVAKTDFDGFQNANFHDDYGDMTFAVNEANILAVAREYHLELEDPADSLRPVSSILKVVQNEATDPPPMVFDPYGDKLTVLLSPKLYEKHSSVRTEPNVSHLLHAIIAVPALMDAIAFSRAREDDEVTEFKWYQHLSRRAAEHGYNLDDETVEPVIIAQAVLADPATRSLSAVSNILDLEDA
jgi:hypothetical protein